MKEFSKCVFSTRSSSNDNGNTIRRAMLLFLHLSNKKYFEDSNQFYVTVLAVLILPSSFFYLITLSSMQPTSIEMKKE